MSVDFGGLGGSSATRFDSLHGRDGFHTALRYPSPFFDIAHTYLPPSVKHMFRWCRYYFLVNPLINAVIYKMAEYPVTKIIFDEEDQDIREFWENYSENHLRLREFDIEVGLDYGTYGNAYVSLHYPFIKFLECQNCGKYQRIEKADYSFRNLDYIYACPSCNTQGPAKVRDWYVKNLRGIRLLRWSPENITVEYNEVTGESAYFYEMPQTLRNDIMIGRRHIIETIPHVFINALKNSKTLRLSPDNLFHLKRPTIAQRDQGYGMPMILPVMKDTYYLQILRKAQEAIAQQHIVPLRILFPQPGSASSDPYSMTDLGSWRRRIEAEIQRWRQDPNYIPVLPLPVGNETIGGEGRALMLNQEMKAWSEQIVAGMHVPAEFIWGGLQYSGSNVSMRMLENSFLGYHKSLTILNRDFILGKIADYMGWRRPKVRFDRFKMADDLQRVALLFQMNQAMKVSDTTLMREADLEVVQEEKFKQAELTKQLENQRRMQIAAATLQGEVSVIQARYQTQAMLAQQAAMGGLMPGGNPGVQPSGPAVPGQGAGKQTSGPGVPGPDMMSVGAGLPQQGQGEQQPVPTEAIPGAVPGGKLYPENADEAPTSGIPAILQSPLTMEESQGGFNILYLARQQANMMRDMPDAERYSAMMNMRMLNPSLYSLVSQILSSRQGSQTDPLNPQQMPMPEQRPTRRSANGML